jgi:hypothetical protein
MWNKISFSTENCWKPFKISAIFKTYNVFTLLYTHTYVHISMAGIDLNSSMLSKPTESNTQVMKTRLQTIGTKNWTLKNNKNPPFEKTTILFRRLSWSPNNRAWFQNDKNYGKIWIKTVVKARKNYDKMRLKTVEKARKNYDKIRIILTQIEKHLPEIEFWSLIGNRVGVSR